MTEKKAAKPETVYILLVETGRTKGASLSSGATGMLVRPQCPC